MVAKNWLLFELPVTDYQRVLDLQERIVAAKISGEIFENVLLILEHKPVFTLGNRGGLINLKVSPSFLQEHLVNLVKTRRGGDITYHGPGQIVAYPIVSLDRHKLAIPGYVNLLEEVMQRTAADLHVTASRSTMNPGIWCDAKKIGSVGIAIRRRVSYHGLALNICPEMSPFSWINPCGLATVETTSIALEGQKSPDIKEARQQMIGHFRSLFHFKTETACLAPLWLIEMVKKLK